MMRPYTLIRSSRKTIAIQITNDGQVLVRCPDRMPAHVVEAFVRSKESWIEKHLQRKRSLPLAQPYTETQLQAFAQRTGVLLRQRLPQFAAALGVHYGRITVRRQKTRWGSCSSKGNLNFNCLLALVPDEVFDYVVVHELCHLKEMNHSPRFWAEVARILPDYKRQKKWLNDHGSALIGRLSGGANG